MTVQGGVLIILCAALGFTNYLIDAQIPAKGAAWVTAGIHSQSEGFARWWGR